MLRPKKRKFYYWEPFVSALHWCDTAGSPGGGAGDPAVSSSAVLSPPCIMLQHGHVRSEGSASVPAVKTVHHPSKAISTQVYVQIPGNCELFNLYSSINLHGH